MSREIIGVFTKFLRYRQKWLGEVYKGTDLAGNKYYEIPADPTRGIKQKRRVEPVNPDNTVVPELPVEWMTWLQKGREDPPTDKEISRNQLINEATLQRAKKVDDAWAKERQIAGALTVDETKPQNETMPFPKYDIYEKAPGVSEYEPPPEIIHASVKNKRTF